MQILSSKKQAIPAGKDPRANPRIGASTIGSVGFKTNETLDAKKKVGNDSKMSFAPSNASSNRVLGKKGQIKIDQIEGVELLG